MRSAAVALAVLLVATLSQPARGDEGLLCATRPELSEITAAVARLVKAKVLAPASLEMPAAPYPWLGSPLTRAEFAAILVRALGLETNGSRGEPVYSDMAGHWAEEAANVLHREGIVKGDPGGTFRPNDLITLPQAKLMLARTLRLGGNLTLETADSALIRGGVKTAVPCETSRETLRAQAFLLLDRALSVPIYARLGSSQ